MSLSTWCRAFISVSTSAKAEDPCSGRFQHRPTRQAGRNQRHSRICARAAPTAANRVRPCPPLSVIGRPTQSICGGRGVSSRCMGLSPVGDVVVAPVAVASRHGRGGPVGTAGCLPARGCSTAGWRWWLAAWLRPCLFLCRWAGTGRAAVSSLGMGWYCCPSCRSVAAYGSQWLSVAGLAVAGPPLGPVPCTVSVAFWPVGGSSCAAGEVQHGEGWPWRQSVAGDPGARTTWCSAC